MMRTNKVHKSWIPVQNHKLQAGRTKQCIVCLTPKVKCLPVYKIVYGIIHFLYRILRLERGEWVHPKSLYVWKLQKLLFYSMKQRAAIPDTTQDRCSTALGEKKQQPCLFSNSGKPL